MESIQNSQTIMSANEGIIVKQFSFQKFSINAAGFLLGIAFILAAVYSQSDTGTTYMLLVTIGVCTALVFGTLLFTRANAIVYVPTRSSMKKMDLYFQTGAVDAIVQAIEAGKMDTLANLAAERNSGVKMEVMYSKDGQYATCQLFTYVPYNYEPASKVFNLAAAQSQAFCTCLQKLQ